jgi:hypothetical protein
VERWNGTAWSVIPSPNFGDFSNELYGVGAITNETWAVGNTLTFSGNVYQTLTERYFDPCGTPLPTNTPSRTPTITGTRTSTPTATNTLTRTPTGTFAPTNSPTPGATRTNAPGSTSTPSVTYTTAPANTATSTRTSTPCPVTFTDVHSTDYFYEPVGYLYCRSVISGYSDGTFKPYNNTTRGQLCKIVVLGEGWGIYTPPTPTFRDVPTDHAFYQYVETAYRHGIISGYTCGTGCLEFLPGNNVTRGQLCKIIVLAEGWPAYTPTLPTFRDVPANQTFYQHIETAYRHNIISGYTCGTNCLEFRPGDNATRGQISKIVYLAVTQPGAR